MLGGGTWSLQNKTLPGAYVNVVSAEQGQARGERGTVAMAMELDWGPIGEVRLITESAFSSNSRELLGYAYEDGAMKPFREIFRHAQKLYLYRQAKNPVAASGSLKSTKFVTAQYPGVRGNRITVQIKNEVDDTSKKDVVTYLDGIQVDTQSVKTAAELEDNLFVRFEKSVSLEAGSVTLSGGTNGEAITGTEQQAFLDAMEPYSFDILASTVQDETTQALFAAYTNRMRNKVGKKFQCVLYRHSADDEGVISVENKVLDDGAKESAMVYWVAGAEAGCAINTALDNFTYDGEYSIDTAYKQNQLEDALQSGKFIFHQQGAEVRVLEDINSLVTVTADKNEAFKQNMTIRIIDEIAADVANLFNNTYNGKVPNDEDGRVGLKADIVDLMKQMEKDRAIQDFNEDDVTIEKGTTAQAVIGTLSVIITGMMTHLYMTVVVQ